jgi:hypothetical protein
MSEDDGSAGQRLRAGLDAALAREAEKLGQPLRWDEREQHHIDAAVRAAGHVEALQRLLDVELGGERRAAVETKLTAEIRLQDHTVSEHLGRLQLGELQPLKSPQHRDAARERWGVQRPKRGA